jgi:hypothetical protein
VDSVEVTEFTDAWPTCPSIFLAMRRCARVRASSIGSIEAAAAASTGLAKKYVDVDTCVVGDVGTATVLIFHLHVAHEGWNFFL